MFWKNKQTGEVVKAQINLSGDWCPWYSIEFKNGKKDHMLATQFEDQFEKLEGENDRDC